MFASFMDVPLHVLVLHVAVTLIPLGAMATVAVMARRQWRARFAGHVAAGNVALLALTFVTARAGIGLQRELDPTGGSVPRNNHEQYGQALLWVVLALTLVSAVSWLAGRLEHFAPAALTGLAAVVILLAVTSAGMTVITGHTGSESHWGGVSP